jgi:hypothetical protein
LHDEGEPCPDPTALLEGTVATVVAQLRYLIGIEIEDEADCIAPRHRARTELRVLGVWCWP